MHLTKEDYGCDMKRDLHNLNLGFIQLKRDVHFDSTDHDLFVMVVCCWHFITTKVL